MRRLVLCLLLVPWHAGGGEILESSIALDDARYRAFVRARIDAPPRAVYDTITDYPALPAITPSIRSAEVLQVLGRGRHRIETVTEACILIFCKDVRLVQDVEQRDGWRLEAVTLPGVSDFKSGLARWRLLPVEGGTELTYDVEAKVGGKLAQLGSRIIGGFARKMADEFFERFQTVVEDGEAA